MSTRQTLYRAFDLARRATPRFVIDRIPRSLKTHIHNRIAGTPIINGNAAEDGVPISELLAAQGIDLRTLQTFRSENFPEDGPQMWLDAPDADLRIDARLHAGTLSAEQADYCRKFARDGYVVVERFFDDAFLDRLWAAFLRDIQAGRVPLEPEKPGEDRSEWGRVLNIHGYVPEMAELLFHERLKKLVSVLVGRDAIPFQTIPSFRGSEQPAHSDAIHMTTYPLGFLSAAWVAFEDIHPDSGPLVYYPGSHKLPYYLSKDVGIGPTEFVDKGRSVYCERYETFIQDKLDELGLQPAYFAAKKGDILVWHHNLIHGGSPRRVRARTRKSVVCHFYASNVVCYHDLSGSRAVVGVQA